MVPFFASLDVLSVVRLQTETLQLSFLAILVQRFNCRRKISNRFNCWRRISNRSLANRLFEYCNTLIPGWRGILNVNQQATELILRISQAFIQHNRILLILKNLLRSFYSLKYWQLIWWKQISSLCVYSYSQYQTVFVYSSLTEIEMFSNTWFSNTSINVLAHILINSFTHSLTHLLAH